MNARVRASDPLDELLAASREGLRLWELFRLEREGLTHYRARPGTEFETHWLEVEAARAAAAGLTDDLSRYELDLIARHEHPNDHLQRRYPRETHVPEHGWIRRMHVLPTHILAVARELLGCAAIRGMTHRGSGDWRLIRLACEEQARRCGAPPTDEDNEFPVSVLAPWTGFDNDPYVEPEEYLPFLSPYPAWSRGVRFQFEGFILYDLYIEDRNLSGGWDHSVVDRTRRFHRDPATKEHIVARAKIVLAGYDDPLRSQHRMWLRHESGWIAGVLTDVDRAETLQDIVARHGFEPEAPMPAGT